MAPAGLHEPFKTLGPINWDFGDIHEPEEEARVRKFLNQTFHDADYLANSIPSDSALPSQQNGRPRASTDPNRLPMSTRRHQPSERSKELSKEWKEVKVNPKENPLGLSVYKLAGKDGKGAWFARRSVHEGQSFDKWKLAMEREFAETMKVKGKPGSGKIRGIGADNRLEYMKLDGCGKLEVYQLSAQFPGPTTPREFLTMLLTTDCALDTPASDEHGKLDRYFMVVSKPCIHPQCPETPGFIRGTYESVEVIREIKIPIHTDPLRKVQSSIDLPTDEANAIARNTVNHLAHEAPIRAAQSPNLNGVPEGDITRSSDTALDTSRQQHQRTPETGHEEYETLLEWVMVTRSDPGGSVPRFMVEKGTPAGIAGDAEKFLKWAESKSMQELLEPEDVSTIAKPEISPDEEPVGERNTTTPQPLPTKPTLTVTDMSNNNRRVDEEEQPPALPGLYSIITGAYGVAASMFPTAFASAPGDTSPETSISTDDDDDRSSIRTFHSFATGQENLDEAPQEPLERTITNGEEHSIQSSTESTATRSQNALSQHEKELRKLEERQRKTEERLQQAQARALAKRGNDGGASEEDVIAKLREKYNRELAKHEEKHERQMRKLEAKRQAEERKAAERRQKQAEREEKRNLTIELDKVRAERDVARKQIEVLKEQVGDLQSQNTMLVARLGKEGIRLEGGIADVFASSDARKRSSSANHNNNNNHNHPQPGRISRASTVLGTPSHHQHTSSPLLAPPKTGRSREHSTHAHAEKVA